MEQLQLGTYDLVTRKNEALIPIAHLIQQQIEEVESVQKEVETPGGKSQRMLLYTQWSGCLV